MEDIMKKILCLALIITAFAGSTFAATLTQLCSTTGAQTIKGGADSLTAAAAATPLIKFSTGVFGLVNYTADSTAKTSAGYLIATRHATGSKNFATASNMTNIFWKQVSAGTAIADLIKSDVGTGDESTATTTFAGGSGWTSY
jgi:choline-glycine betaine transporter